MAVTPWTPPKTIADGDTLLSSDWNTYVRNNLLALYAPPQARVYHNANQSIPSGSGTALEFNSGRKDNDGMHDPATNNSRLTARTAGGYLFGAHIAWAVGTTGYRQIAFRINGATIPAAQRDAAIDGAFQFLTTYYVMAVDDYIEVVVEHTQGSAINVETKANWSQEFWAVWQGA